jgi:hypothetical protein
VFPKRPPCTLGSFRLFQSQKHPRKTEGARCLLRAPGGGYLAACSRASSSSPCNSAASACMPSQNNPLRTVSVHPLHACLAPRRQQCQQCMCRSHRRETEAT